MRLQIEPSILSADMGRLADELQAVEEGGADLIHIDVMDGHFVPNLCMGMGVVKAAKKYTKLPLDVHLMISEPLSFIDHFADAGADMISFHQEASHTPLRVIDKIHERGLQAGVATAPGTNVNVYDELLGSLDYALLVCVEPGFGNQKFRQSVLRKISSLKESLEAADRKNVPIQVDGGVNSQTLRSAAYAGASIYVVGSAIFEAEDYKAQIAEYRRLLESV